MMRDLMDTKSISVLGLIPARAGSKGVPGKNIAPLAGIPLIAHTVRAAKGSRLLTDIMVSTDGEQIAEVCRKEGVAVPWLRPVELAGDLSKAQDVALHALQNTPNGKAYDYLMLLQPTAPFRSSEDIDESIRLAARHNAESVVSFVFEETRHPYYMYTYEAEKNGQPAKVMPFAQYEVGLPRQKFPPCVYRNGAIYLVRCDYFLRQHSFVSPDLVPYLMPPERSVNIDAREDLDFAEYLLSRKKSS